MKKLTEQETALIEDYRTAQIARAALEEKGFEELLTKLGTRQESDQTFNDFLFDYIYNSADSSSEWLNFLIKNVYGDQE